MDDKTKVGWKGQGQETRQQMGFNVAAFKGGGGNNPMNSGRERGLSLCAVEWFRRMDGGSRYRLR